MSANDRQVAGSHYAGSLQHWDFVAAALSGRYLEGQITKYIFRWPKKNGIQDLEKAAHYLEKLIETGAAPQKRPRELRLIDYAPPFNGAQYYAGSFSLDECFAANGLGPTEIEICKRLIIWRTREDLDIIDALVSRLIAAQYGADR